MARLRKLATSREKVEIEISMSDTLLTVSARRTDGASLLSPVMGSMKGRIDETLTSEITVKLTRNGKTVFHGTGTDAGLEVIGEIR